MMICATVTLLAMSGSRNLLVNGDFKRGNQGFASSYGLSTDLLGDGTYAIGKDPKGKHHGACSIQDPLKRNRNMLLLNGSATANLSFWSETIPVEPNHTYEFHFSGASWSKNPIDGTENDMSPARIIVRINGVALSAPFGLSPRAGDWSQFSIKWFSGSAKEARIRLYDDNQDIAGNDFAIDDLFFGKIQDNHKS